MLLCFLVASTFWVLNSLNKLYQNIRINYPITFVYDSARLIPVNAQPKEVAINVSGKGWKLLRCYFDLRIRPVSIVLLAAHQKNFLTSQELRPLVNAGLIHGLDLNYVSTDTLHFNFQPLVQRHLLLKADSSKSLTAAQFTISGPIRLEPQLTSVSGPASLVNALPNPYLIRLPDSLLSRDYSATIPLAFPSPKLIKSSQKEVQVSFRVVPMHEGKFQAAVRLRQTEVQSQHITGAKPSNVQVLYYFLPESRLINPAEIAIEADLNLFNPADSTAPLLLVHKPAAVKTVSFSPKKVKILFRKK